MSNSTDTSVVKSAAAKLFDIRFMIGALFVVYGLMLTIAGFFSTQAEIDKAAGLNINLWLGLGMLVLGLLFLLWRKLSPPEAPQANPTEAGPPGAH